MAETSEDEYGIDEEDELLMHNYHTLPSQCKKYWNKRYSLFSKFDEGIYMTSELWFSVTPEDIASFTALLVAQSIPEAEKILDLCCGGGGNTIQFAKVFRSVCCIDVNRLNMKCTEHNAEIYGVRDRIFPVVGDWNEISASGSEKTNFDWVPEIFRTTAANTTSASQTFDFIFCSPPWGGPSYNKSDTYSLLENHPFALDLLCHQINQYSQNFGLFLPRTLDLSQLSHTTKTLFGPEAKCRVIYLLLHGYCKGILALFGDKLTSETIDYSNLVPTDAEFSE